MEIKCICYDLYVKEIATKIVAGEEIKYGDKCGLCLTYVEKEILSIQSENKEDGN